MHDLRTIFRNSLLFCAIAADFCFISVRADKVINYTVPSKGSVYGNVATKTGQETWAVNSRKVRTTGYGAAASATASRSSYGFVGRMTVSRAFFQAWLAYEIGSLGLEWIASQYELAENETLDKELNINKEIEAYNYLCDIEQCYYKVRNSTCEQTKYATLFAAATAAQNCAIKETNSRCSSNTEYCKYVTNFNNENFSYTVNIYKKSGAWQGGIIYSAGKYGNGLSQSLGLQKYNDKHPAGEPTKDPDPYLTAAILDRWAHIVPEMRARVSDTVDFVPSPARYTEKDVLGNVLKDYEGVLEPMEEPVANPHKTAKRPAPEIEPTPQLKTKDLLTGNEITQPTEPIKEPTSDTTTQTVPKVEVDVDLSKLEHTTAEILEQQKEFEIEHEPDDTEIEVPEDLDEAGIWGAVGRLKVPVLQPEALLNRMMPVADSWQQQQLTSSTSATCPPPMTLTIIGGRRIEMPFDPICTFLEKVKFILVPLIGWIIALGWLKRINSN